MAGGAPDGREQCLTGRDRGGAARCGGRGYRRGQQTHKLREEYDIRRDLSVLRGRVRVRRHREIRCVFRISGTRQVETRGGKSGPLLILAWQRPVLREKLVGNAHFYVVSLAGEKQQ